MVRLYCPGKFRLPFHFDALLPQELSRNNYQILFSFKTSHQAYSIITLACMLVGAGGVMGLASLCLSHFQEGITFTENKMHSYSEAKTQGLPLVGIWPSTGLTSSYLQRLRGISSSLFTHR